MNSFASQTWEGPRGWPLRRHRRPPHPLRMNTPGTSWLQSKLLYPRPLWVSRIVAISFSSPLLQAGHREGLSLNQPIWLERRGIARLLRPSTIVPVRLECPRVAGGYAKVNEPYALRSPNYQGCRRRSRSEWHGLWNMPWVAIARSLPDLQYPTMLIVRSDHRLCNPSRSSQKR